MILPVLSHLLVVSCGCAPAMSSAAATLCQRFISCPLPRRGALEDEGNLGRMVGGLTRLCSLGQHRCRLIARPNVTFGMKSLRTPALIKTSAGIFQSVAFCLMGMAPAASCAHVRRRRERLQRGGVCRFL